MRYEEIHHSLSKKIAVGVLCIAAIIYTAIKSNAAESTGPTIGLEPYGTLSWTGLEGEADLGAGLAATLGITKNLSIVAFAEGDTTSDPNFFDQIDRAGAGLRYTAPLGKHFSLDAGVAGAWNIENSAFFLRLPLGANLYAVRTKDVTLGLRAQYAFDISGSGANGTAAGRAFVGPVLTYSF
jgi:hypothetical protein